MKIENIDQTNSIAFESSEKKSRPDRRRTQACSCARKAQENDSVSTKNAAAHTRSIDRIAQLKQIYRLEPFTRNSTRGISLVMKCECEGAGGIVEEVEGAADSLARCDDFATLAPMRACVINLCADYLAWFRVNG